MQLLVEQGRHQHRLCLPVYQRQGVLEKRVHSHDQGHLEEVPALAARAGPPREARHGPDRPPGPAGRLLPNDRVTDLTRHGPVQGGGAGGPPALHCPDDLGVHLDPDPAQDAADKAEEHVEREHLQGEIRQGPLVSADVAAHQGQEGHIGVRCPGPVELEADGARHGRQEAACVSDIVKDLWQHKLEGEHHASDRRRERGADADGAGGQKQVDAVHTRAALPLLVEARAEDPRDAGGHVDVGAFLAEGKT
mmetsp:Transcript_78282/g.221336  ORF Transcript_78282/g.221336 Transcript_78282/m.221336 type:complete len:250 (+) Transcript_78282:1114-1863(+)